MFKTYSFMFAAFFSIATLAYGADDKVTLEGTLVSSVCYLGGSSHPMTNDMGGKKGCGTFCLRKGDPAGLVTNNDKQFHALVVSSLVLAPYVGERVRVTGEDHNGAILVDRVELSKDGTWKELNLKPKK